MSFDLTFYTKKFTKEQVLPLLQKLEKENEIKFTIGEVFYTFDKDGDNFVLDGEEIYAETFVSDFNPIEYFADEEEGYEQKLANGELLQPILSKCDLEITFCCHLAQEIEVIKYFCQILVQIFPDSVLTNHYEGENYTGKEIVTQLAKIQEEFEDE